MDENDIENDNYNFIAYCASLRGGAFNFEDYEDGDDEFADLEDCYKYLDSEDEDLDVEEQVEAMGLRGGAAGGPRKKKDNKKGDKDKLKRDKDIKRSFNNSKKSATDGKGKGKQQGHVKTAALKAWGPTTGQWSRKFLKDVYEVGKFPKNTRSDGAIRRLYELAYGR